MTNFFSNDLEFEDCTPPKLKEQINKESERMIPSTSKKEYDRIYNDFKKYLVAQKTTKISSSTVFGYFTYLATEKIFVYSTLWKNYSALKAELKIHENFDISKFDKIVPYICSFKKGYVAKKSLIFEQDQIDKFMSDAPNSEYLLHKISFFWFIWWIKNP